VSYLRHAENGLAWPSDTAHRDPGRPALPPDPANGKPSSKHRSKPSSKHRTMHQRDPCADSRSVLSASRTARA
jgi:hypothetical protein